MSNILEMQKEIAEPKPLPLPSDRKELPIFNIDCLPKVMADYVDNLADAIQQPRQYIATSCLVSIAGLLGNKVCLNIDDRKAYPILWGMLIGDSGTGKTPSINEPMRPIKEIDKQFLDDYLKDYANYQTALELYDIELKTLKANLKDCKDEQKQSIKEQIEAFKKLKPLKPYSREICINTATKEALLSQLADDSPNGLILEIDELMDFIQSIIKSEKIEDHKLYVESFNSGSFKSKTISRGTQYIENVTISIIGGVQTQRLLEFTNRYNGSGLLARFQLIPIAEKQQRIYKDTKLDFGIKSEYINLLNTLKNIPQRFNIVDNQKTVSEPKKYSYTSEAKSLYINWFNKNERVKNESGQSDLMIEYLGKATNTFHALALIYHLADNHDSDHISKEVVQKVIATLDYFYDCAKYIYADEADLVIKHAKQILSLPLKDRMHKNGFTASSLHSRYSSIKNKTTMSTTIESLDLLYRYNHLKEVDTKPNAKYKKYISIS